MKTKSKPKSQSKPKSKGCRRAATCSPRSIAKKIAKHLFTVGGTPQNDKATHLCLFDGGHKGKYLSGWSEAAAVYAIERIIQANASHQAPAALDAAITQDASSRLPACAGSPSNDKPSNAFNE